jgi:hypothetical protein
VANRFLVVKVKADQLVLVFPKIVVTAKGHPLDLHVQFVSCIKQPQRATLFIINAMLFFHVACLVRLNRSIYH